MEQYKWAGMGRWPFRTQPVIRAENGEKKMANAPAQKVIYLHRSWRAKFRGADFSDLCVCVERADENSSEEISRNVKHYEIRIECSICCIKSRNFVFFSSACTKGKCLYMLSEKTNIA